jgi:hypothetical protein
MTRCLLPINTPEERDCRHATLRKIESRQMIGVDPSSSVLLVSKQHSGSTVNAGQVLFCAKPVEVLTMPLRLILSVQRRLENKTTKAVRYATYPPRSTVRPPKTAYRYGLLPDGDGYAWP